MTTGIFIHFNKTATQLAEEFSVEQFASKDSFSVFGKPSDVSTLGLLSPKKDVKFQY